jgi:hypothetical protein
VFEFVIRGEKKLKMTDSKIGKWICLFSGPIRINLFTIYGFVKEALNNIKTPHRKKYS